VKKLFSVSVGTLLLGAVLWPLATASAEQPAKMKIAAPEFKGVGEWINSKPLQLKHLRGKVVVLHFWAFG
jgi:hypothetical protein